MSLISKLFRKKKSKSHDAKEKIGDLEDTLQRKCEYLESKIADEVAIAKENVTTNKRLAMSALKRKKRLEEQLKQTEGTLENLEAQRISIDNAKLHAEVVKATEGVNCVLKAAHKETNADKVHDVMDDLADQHYLAKEISDAVSTPTHGSSVDDEELEKELAELQKLDEIATPVPVLPVVPCSVPVLVNAEDKELEELAAQLTS